ncbi:4Fe-4S single cluster domain-containing protein [Actinoplanes sp. RD1]|uniref:4Fe-4S single cluster domain-containing protein n=1 Tax=Actinoplanes sp. RD1 TaxID=3064538 RepID=UPI002742966B|nr:4Fe-4S single cluster domain-containing protein [Actinoplanes sp. RD1]
MLNVAAITTGTRALGPGLRSVLWVQGCPFRCAGCIAESWIPVRPATAMTPGEAAQALSIRPDVRGVTFSGGEPMEQATGLSEVIRLMRQDRELDLICFTGYRLERLLDDPPNPGVPNLLAEVDVLIDGLYVRSRDDGLGLRGSTNQRVHHLSGLLTDIGYDFAGRVRAIELQQAGDDLLMVGVPDPVLASAFQAAHRED